MNIDVHRVVAVIAAFIFATTAISAAVMPAIGASAAAPRAVWS